MLLIYVYVTVVVPLCRSRHGSFIIALVDLSGSARLSVHWPQNCFYKCKSRCFIALQPNRITRLFSYSREVEQRLRAAQMKTYGHLCVCVCLSFCSFPVRSFLFLCLFPILSSHILAICPDFHRTHALPPFHPHPLTNIHQWLELQQMLAALPPNSLNLIWGGHPFSSWVCWRPSLSWPAQLAGADCQSASGVFPLTFGYHGLNQRARLGSAETDAFCSCLLVWFWRELGFVITYCISCLLYLRIEENLQPGCALLCCLFCWEGAWLLWDCTVRWPW